MHTRSIAILNVTLLVATVAVLATGLVLLTEFHMGHGARATAWAGLAKASWRNIHRIAAVLAIGATALHLWRHRRLCSSILIRRRGQAILLLLFVVIAATGATAWVALPCDTPALRHPRHACIDIHDFAGLGFTVGATHHILHRRRRIL